MLVVRKIVDKGNRGDSILFQNKMLSEQGYTNHKSKLLDQLKTMNSDEKISPR